MQADERTCIDMAGQTAIVAAKPKAMSMADELSFAQTVADGSLLPQAYRGNPANVLIAVNLGQAMGLGPAESLYRINVIQGKPTASAELIAAQVRKAGHKLRIDKDEARQSVTATIVRCDDPDYPISETRDADWAKSMGLASKDNYRKQPMTMLTWRAITAAAREACPEALYGVAYTPDEMSDMQPEPRAAEASAAPMSAAPAKAKAQQKPARNAASYMKPVRDLFKPWAAALDLHAQDAASLLAEKAGAASMAGMTAAQAAKAVAIMQADLSEAQEDEQAAEPEPVYETDGGCSEEVDF